MHQLISKPQWSALLVGTLVFAALYWAGSIGLSTLVNWWYYPSPSDDLPNAIASSWLWAGYGWSLNLIPGFIAGAIARRSGLMHGAIVGALTMPIMALIIYSAGYWSGIELSSLTYGFVVAVIWCALGGLIGEFLSVKTIGRK